MNKYMEYFSRKFDKNNFDRALTIYKKLKSGGKDLHLLVHTYELYDKAFTFPKIRKF